ncbi:MAG: arylsulfatase [Planctomycetota bacterium]|nr:arylsulfatase [Planctomycetota bacterium]
MRTLCMVCVLLVSAVSVGSADAQAQRQARPPNVVFIMADDLGYREVGAFGQEKIRTPNIDRLAAEGLRLTRHYSGSAVCAPTRSILMTGLHAGHATIRGNKPTPGGTWDPESPEGQWPIPDEDFTLAEMFKEAGYVTGAFGKWGLGGPGSTGHPNNQGFDHFYGYLCQRVAHNYYPTHLWRNHDVDVLDGNAYFPSHQRITEPLASEAAYDERYRGQTYAPTEIAAEMLGWVRAQHEEHPDQPFFLYYPTVIPHVALQAPKEFVDSYPDGWDTEHYLGNRGYLPNATPRATYAAMITYMDSNIGRLLDLLDELGLADNTLVVFTSDNGTTYVSGVDRDFFDSLGELRGHKGNLWEGGIRMPTVVRWPGVVAPGSESATPSYHPDWMATLAGVAGWNARPPVGMGDGIDLRPVLRGEADTIERDFMYWEFPEGQGQQAVIFGEGGRWKAIRPRLKKNPDVLELYDLRADPGEQHNVAADHPDLVARAARIMREQHTPSRLFPFKALD